LSLSNNNNSIIVPYNRKYNWLLDQLHHYW